MPKCPQCEARVGLKPIFTSTGMSGIVCPGCGTSLEPVPWTALLSTVAAIGAGILVPGWLKLSGASRVAAMLALIFGITCAGYATIVRLRARRRPIDLLR